MGKKVKKDDKPAADDVFDPLLVESKQAVTVVLMLDSPEEEVLAKACEAIYKFVDKCDENRKQLLDLGAVEKLASLIRSEDRVIRRNACMCLGVMTVNPEVRRSLRRMEDFIPSVLALLSPEEESTVMHEFAALTLCNLCNEFSSKLVVFEQDGIEPIIRCIQSADPDVQKNGIETLALLMQDYHSRASVREHEGFPPILELLKSEFAVIQELALVCLTRAALDAENRAVLRELQALNVLVNFVGKPEYNDLHVHALHCLSNCLEDVESMQQIKDNGGLARLIAFIVDRTPPEEESSSSGGGKDKKKPGSKKGKKGQSDEGSSSDYYGYDDDESGRRSREEKKGGEPSHTLPEVKRHACKAIARAAHLVENRKLLHEQEVEKMCIALLAHEDQTVQTAAAQALGIMAESVSSRQSIAGWEGIDPLIKLLKPDNGEVRESVTLALANLTVQSTINCVEIMTKNGIESLINMLGDAREHIVANSATVLTNMSVIENVRSEIQRLGVVNALVSPLKSESPLVQSRVATAVAAFVIESDARNDFRQAGGLEPLVELLKSNDDEVRRNASWAVTIVAVDEATAADLSRLGVLEILQDIQLSGTRQNRFTEAAMKRMLNNNLPAKYALTGCLSSTDVIADGFYDAGQLRPGTQFLSLEDYCKLPVNQKRPILLISSKIPSLEEPDSARSSSSNVSKPSSALSSEDSSKMSLSAKKSKRKGKRAQSQTRAVESQEEVEKEEEDVPEEFAMPCDPNFAKYVNEVREKILQMTDTKQQVVTLAEYVSDRLGGGIDRGQVSSFSYELSISQLKFNLESNVIPLGMITAGIHYHRALLFKALADRAGVPCTLVRGEYNRAWNEVMLEDENQTPEALKYPPKCYVVDLVYQPGFLMRADSIEASSYQKI